MNREAIKLPTRMAIAAVVATTLLVACASPWTGTDYYEAQTRLTEADGHIDGEALAQRKEQMRRAHNDLVSVHATMQSLRRHRSYDDIHVFEEFLHPYLNNHVKPLLSEEADGWNTELALLDANLLFAQAAVLIELRDRRRTDRVISEISKRFTGMDDMLVEYPMGEQSTLVRGLIDLRTLRSQI